jgi:hypothetical protein
LVGGGLKYVSPSGPPCTFTSVGVLWACDQLNFISTQIGPAKREPSVSIAARVTCSTFRLTPGAEEVPDEKGTRWMSFTGRRAASMPAISTSSIHCCRSSGVMPPMPSPCETPKPSRSGYSSSVWVTLSRR